MMPRSTKGREVTTEKLRSYECYKCEAPPGKPCRCLDTDKPSKNIHQDRYEQYYLELQGIKPLI
jgi:hypothetical protein